jgi:hypothetical protein
MLNTMGLRPHCIPLTLEVIEMEETKIVFKSPCTNCLCKRCVDCTQEHCDDCEALSPIHECDGFKSHTINDLRDELWQFIHAVMVDEVEASKEKRELKYPEYAGMRSISVKFENLTQYATSIKLYSDSRIRYSIIINSNEDGSEWWFTKPRTNKRNIDEIPDLETPQKQHFMNKIIGIIEKYIGCSYDERIKRTELQTTFKQTKGN